MESAGAAWYLLGLFVYAIATATLFPTPVEVLLPFHPEVDLAAKAIALGAGKAVGAIAVFYVGHKVNPFIERWMARHPFGHES